MSSICCGIEPTDNMSVSPLGAKLSAKFILDKVANTYQQCDTYVDSGTSVTTSNTPITTSEDKDGREFQLLREFHTSFQRGKEFRFAFRKNSFGKRFERPRILWHDGKRTMVNRSDSDVFEPEESLGMAVARLTGTSGGSSHLIPALLIPDEVGGSSILALSNLKKPVLKEIVKKRNCYRVEGEFGGETAKLWIDTDTFLLVRLEEHSLVGGISYQRVTSLEPALNENIPDKLFGKYIENEWKAPNPMLHPKNNSKP